MNAIATATTGSARHHAAFVAILAALAGPIFGLDVGAISRAQQFIRREFGVDDAVIERLVSSKMPGAGAAFATYRRFTSGASAR